MEPFLHKVYSLPMLMVIEMAQGRVMPLEELKTREKWKSTLLTHRGVKDHDTARTPSILG